VLSFPLHLRLANSYASQRRRILFAPSLRIRTSGRAFNMSMGGPAYQALTHRSTHAPLATFGPEQLRVCAAALKCRSKMRSIALTHAQQTSGIGAVGLATPSTWRRPSVWRQTGRGQVMAATLIHAGLRAESRIFSGSGQLLRSVRPP